MIEQTKIGPQYVYAIKVKKKTEKRWSFLTPRGGTNHLRIHAAQFDTSEKAQKLIDANAADNPDFEWKVAELFGDHCNTLTATSRRSHQ